MRHSGIRHSSFRHHGHHAGALRVGGYGAHRGVQNRSTKIALRIIGAILLIIGLIIVLIGASQQSSTAMGNEDWFEQSSAGMFKIFGGLVLIIIGAILLYVSFIRRVASYYAEELSPALETATDAVGAGITRGIQRSGGIKLDIQTSGQAQHSSPVEPREVIKIKCRSCGYLETEDADFCSKCGKKM